MNLDIGNLAIFVIYIEVILRKHYDYFILYEEANEAKKILHGQKRI